MDKILGNSLIIIRIAKYLQTQDFVNFVSTSKLLRTYSQCKIINRCINATELYKFASNNQYLFETIELDTRLTPEIISTIGSNNKLCISSNLENFHTDIWPSNITEINIYSKINNKISLPQNLTKLNFIKEYNFPVDNMPKTLTMLDIPSLIPNSSIDLLSNITKLFLKNVTSDISIWPPKLESLNIGTDRSSICLINLPDTLKVIKKMFGISKPFRVDKLPKNLTCLKISVLGMFGDLIYPDSITKINIDNTLTENILKWPNSAKTINIQNQKITDIGILPESCTFLNLDASNLKEDRYYLPNLTNLTLNLTNIGLKSLSKLTTLIIHKSSYQIDEWPTNLTYLSLKKYPYKLVHLPDSLKTLICESDFNFVIKKWPKSLTKVKFMQTFNRYQEHWPPNLQSITYGDSYTQSYSKLPDSVTKISYGKKHCKDIMEWPLSIKKLVFFKLNKFTFPPIPITVHSLEIAYPVKCIFMSIDDPDAKLYEYYPQITISNPDTILIIHKEYSHKKLMQTKKFKMIYHNYY